MRWVMTLTFVVVSTCFLAAALASPPAAATGRLILMAGAVAGVFVAANPEHPGDAYPVPHVVAASAGFAGLIDLARRTWRRGLPGALGAFGTPWPLLPPRCCCPGPVVRR